MPVIAYLGNEAMHFIRDDKDTCFKAITLNK